MAGEGGEVSKADCLGEKMRRSLMGWFCWVRFLSSESM